jgi:hypothetical protein
VLFTNMQGTNIQNTNIINTYTLLNKQTIHAHYLYYIHIESNVFKQQKLVLFTNKEEICKIQIQSILKDY